MSEAVNSRIFLVIFALELNFNLGDLYEISIISFSLMPHHVVVIESGFC